jgi:HPr kinase/phosphorylase
VSISKRAGRYLIGTGLEISKHLIEVRGVGIIDIRNVFGIGSTLDEARVELVIKLEEWNKVNKLDRVGLEEFYEEILDVSVPQVTIPVGPGRNLAVLVETASLNQRLKNKGFSSARELDERIKKMMNKGKDEN